MTSVDRVLDVTCELGEGPVWVGREQALWFTDIKGRKIHRFDPATKAHAIWDAPDQPGFVLPKADGGMIAGLRPGLFDFDPAAGSFALKLAPEPDRPQNRLNDGSVDGQGRLWFGSMDDSEAGRTGSLFRHDGRGLVRCDDEIGIANGPCHSPDGKTFYHTDTTLRTVFAFDMAADGSLSNKRALIEIEEGAGFPDGSVVDSAGTIWVALFAGHGVRRYAPDGRLMQTVHFPVPNVTKIAFGGPDLRTAYATTAWLFMDEAKRAQFPLAGALFAFAAPDPGLAGVEIALA